MKKLEIGDLVRWDYGERSKKLTYGIITKVEDDSVHVYWPDIRDTCEYYDTALIKVN